MSTISASLVKELRDKTNAGMMECKAALVEAGGDLQLAEDILRKKGIVKAGKKADREAKDGVVSAAISADGTTGVLLEVNCETDFVSKNENFRTFVAGLTDLLLASGVADGDTGAFMAAAHPAGGSVEEVVKAKIAEIGENIVLRRCARFVAAPGARFATYIHMQGRVGVLLETGATKPETFERPEVGAAIKDITLHITAASPSCISRDQVEPALVAKEREIYAEQVKGKPAAVLDKIVDGKMVKFYSQVCLLEQGFIKDPERTVADHLQAVGRQAGDTLTVLRFQRFAIGEA
jgi:elongation factor Ts